MSRPIPGPPSEVAAERARRHAAWVEALAPGAGVVHRTRGVARVIRVHRNLRRVELVDDGNHQFETTSSQVRPAPP